MNDWCVCDYSRPAFQDDGYCCLKCGRPIPCDICELLDSEIGHATTQHIDYYVCDTHLQDSIGNVSGRDL